MTIRQRILEKNARVGRYRILKELGRGGMGVVYLAHDDNLDRQVALKTTQVASIGASEQMRNQRRHRFIREVQALAQLSHENVVHVYDAGEADHPDLGWILFYTMQFVEGITLAELVIRRGAIEPNAAAAICAQIASGLGAGHASGIIHRDVKPANVFLSVEGRALIGDFGIAKLADATQITRRDQMVGTPNYLAPEQILGDETTAATDVFALGALFYMVTMRRPLRTKVDATSLIEAARANVARGKMLSALTVPRGLRNVVARALDQDPAKRFPDGHAFAEALSDFATRVPPLREEPSEPKTDEGTFRAQFRTVDTDTFSAPLDVVEQSARRAGVSGGATGAGAKIPLADKSEHAGSRSVAMGVTVDITERGHKTARTESTAVFNVRNLKLPEEMDFSGMDEELPNLVPVKKLDLQRRDALPRGNSEGDEIYLLRSALAFLQDQIDEKPVLPDEVRMQLPLDVDEVEIGSSPPEKDVVRSIKNVSESEVPRIMQISSSSQLQPHSEIESRGDFTQKENDRGVLTSKGRTPREAICSEPNDEDALSVPLPEDDLRDDAVFDSVDGEVSPGWLSRLTARWRTPKN